METIKVGFAMCGSFCTFDKALEAMRGLRAKGYDITPIQSYHAATLDTRFGKAADFQMQIEAICEHKIITTIVDAEPIGPKKMFDILLIAPCTGNTISKLAWGITDTPVLMAAKSHMRNDRPVVIAAATNDALSGSAKSLGMLLNTKNMYFVPLAQDNPEKKFRSMVADFDRIEETMQEALKGRQIEPIVFAH